MLPSYAPRLRLDWFAFTFELAFHFGWLPRCSYGLHMDLRVTVTRAFVCLVGSHVYVCLRYVYHPLRLHPLPDRTLGLIGLPSYVWLHPDRFPRARTLRLDTRAHGLHGFYTWLGLVHTHPLPRLPGWHTQFGYLAVYTHTHSLRFCHWLVYHTRTPHTPHVHTARGATVCRGLHCMPFPSILPDYPTRTARTCGHRCLVDYARRAHLPRFLHGSRVTRYSYLAGLRVAGYADTRTLFTVYSYRSLPYPALPATRIAYPAWLHSSRLVGWFLRLCYLGPVTVPPTLRCHSCAFGLLIYVDSRYHLPGYRAVAGAPRLPRILHLLTGFALLAQFTPSLPSYRLQFTVTCIPITGWLLHGPAVPV